MNFLHSTNKLLTVFVISLTLISCNAYKKIPYLQNAESLTQEQLKEAATVYDAKIMPNDILSITINSQTPGVSKDFNLTLLPQGSDAISQTYVSTAASTTGTLQNYLVNKDGSIDFPVLGTIKAEGLTRTEFQDRLASLIYPKYITEKPIVNVRFLNYRVSVLGEVAKPGIYTSDNGVMTLFDALASAGDLTIYGKRENVMLLRENADGELSVRRINLQDKDLLLNKDIYYLQQNDKIIVEANKARGNSSSIGTLQTIGLSALSVLISVIAIITR